MVLTQTQKSFTRLQISKNVVLWPNHDTREYFILSSFVHLSESYNHFPMDYLKVFVYSVHPILRQNQWTDMIKFDLLFCYFFLYPLFWILYGNLGTFPLFSLWFHWYWLTYAANYFLSSNSFVICLWIQLIHISH